MKALLRGVLLYPCNVLVEGTTALQHMDTVP